MAKRSYDKKPLYRRVNRRTHSLWHPGGGEYRWDRNTKREQANEATDRSMGGKQQHGLDYTPLFKFLLSRVGSDWDQVYSEAVSRLPSDEPIFYMVARNPDEMRDIVRVDEGTLFSGLYVADDGRLAKVAPEIGVEDITPYCPCHTHTFNGEVVTNPCTNPQFLEDGSSKPWGGYLKKEAQ